MAVDFQELADLAIKKIQGGHGTLCMKSVATRLQLLVGAEMFRCRRGEFPNTAGRRQFAKTSDDELVVCMAKISQGLLQLACHPISNDDGRMAVLNYIKLCQTQVADSKCCCLDLGRVNELRLYELLFAFTDPRCLDRSGVSQVLVNHHTEVI